MMPISRYYGWWWAYVQVWNWAEPLDGTRIAWEAAIWRRRLNCYVSAYQRYSVHRDKPNGACDRVLVIQIGGYSFYTYRLTYGPARWKRDDAWQRKPL